MKQVVLMESLGIPEAELAALEAEFRQEAVFTAWPRTADPARMIRQAEEADAIILANMPLPGQVIRACPRFTQPTL